jgi:surface antigen
MMMYQLKKIMYTGAILLVALSTSVPSFAQGGNTSKSRLGSEVVPASSQNAEVFRKVALAASSCQCVEFVKQYSGIDVPVGNAKDMVNSLPRLGFRPSSSKAKSIVVFQPTFPGVNDTYGHTGIVTSVTKSGGNTYITVLSANNGGSGTRLNCNNVNTVKYRTPINGRRDVSFFAKNDPSIDRREANQKDRINAGVQSRALTPKETDRLQRQQDKINNTEAKFKLDGKLSNRERRVLKQRLNKSSKSIYRAKHNKRHI